MVDILRVGGVAIPALRELLFEREQSGLFDARCRAAEALAALGAFDVLGEFLSRPRVAGDAVESLGDDVVISTAARAIAQRRAEWVYSLLYSVGSTTPLRGVLVALGSFLTDESIPIFISALEEDEVRSTAEAVLRDFGVRARPALLAACRAADFQEESESHLRKRRAALSLLIQIGVPEHCWPVVRDLVRDRDSHISTLAAEACVVCRRSRP